MLFIFSKIFNFFTSPINWILILTIISFLLKAVKWKRILFSVTLFLLLFFTNNQIYILAVNYWSAPYKKQFPPNEVFEIAIVVGGAINYSPNWQQINYNERADRITEAIRLYRLGKIKRLYLSGEAAFNVKGEISYASEFLRYMEEMGVNQNDIILEQQARTTAENTKYIQELVANKNCDILLITSAWHMRRTLKGFRGSGLNLVPYAVDIPEMHPKQIWTDYLPSWKAAQNWQKLLHEMAGLLII